MVFRIRFLLALRAELMRSQQLGHRRAAYMRTELLLASAELQKEFLGRADDLSSKWLARRKRYLALKIKAESAPHEIVRIMERAMDNAETDAARGPDCADFERHFAELLDPPPQDQDNAARARETEARVQQIHAAATRAARDSWCNIPPSLDEVKKAVNKCKTRKHPGADDLPIELFQLGGVRILQLLHRVICCFWKLGAMPAALSLSLLNPLLKQRQT